MTVKEIFERSEAFNDEDRAKYIGGLCKVLSPVSMSTLYEFQDSWDVNKSPEEFFKAQSKEIKDCVELEIGPTGKMVRQAAGLEPLTWETEIVA
ncbi:hypothetical protein LCGC14_2241510 [marine sediment metagenome]|uniref:Uncharacterized protein n=1 Tax=marine sediment metagenome TaxID=412755 RepID=A0A0F9DSW3_9ZZZZ